MIQNLKLSLPFRETLFPQHTLSFRLNLGEVEFVHNPRNGQSELDVSDGLSDAAAGTDGERRVGISGSFDGVFGSVFWEPALGDE